MAGSQRASGVARQQFVAGDGQAAQVGDGMGGTRGQGGGVTQAARASAAPTAEAGTKCIGAIFLPRTLARTVRGANDADQACASVSNGAERYWDT